MKAKRPGRPAHSPLAHARLVLPLAWPGRAYDPTRAKGPRQQPGAAGFSCAGRIWPRPSRTRAHTTHCLDSRLPSDGDAAGDPQGHDLGLSRAAPRGGNRHALVRRGVPHGAAGRRCAQREPHHRKPGAEVIKAVAESAISGVANVDRRSELAQLLLLTPVGVETFGLPTAWSSARLGSGSARPAPHPSSATTARDANRWRARRRLTRQDRRRCALAGAPGQEPHPASADRRSRRAAHGRRTASTHPPGSRAAPDNTDTAAADGVRHRHRRARSRGSRCGEWARVSGLGSGS